MRKMIYCEMSNLSIAEGLLTEAEGARSETFGDQQQLIGSAK